MWSYYNVLLEEAKERKLRALKEGRRDSLAPKARDRKPSIQEDPFVVSLSQSAAGKQWKRVGIREHHGIVVPLFSLHSQNTCGVGDFSALEAIIPWVRSLGMDVIQLLPLNETNRDNSPFSGLSAFALDPIFISLENLPNLHKHEDLLEQLRTLKKKLGCVEEDKVRRVDYPAVREAKRDFLAKYLECERQGILNSDEYKAFYDTEKLWLDGYALFKILKRTNAWKAWWEWPKELRDPKPEDLCGLREKYSIGENGRVEDEMIVQYICTMQMKHVKESALAQGVHIKGDIPYLISKDSADVWLPQSRKFFDLTFYAGAPPDSFNPEGQSWGMPVYNWDELAQDGYSWWKERLRVAEKFFDIYRIDHIVGFFRVWAIEEGKSGATGKYLPVDPEKWQQQGEHNLGLMLESCQMLPIGEDLGTLPDCCRPTLTRLGICGTKVMIWEREWTNMDQGQPFIHFEDYPKCSMTTVSTHDSEPLRMWWEHNPDQSAMLCDFLDKPHTEKLSKSDHKDILRNSHQSSSLFHINPLMEFLPLVDGLVWDSLDDERVNIPGKLLDTNWAYCFRPSVEEMISHHDLRMAIVDCVKKGPVPPSQ